MNPVNGENVRDVARSIFIGLALAWVLSGCAAEQAPPFPTAAQLAPAPVVTPAAPRITGAMILAQQPAEVQYAIGHHQQQSTWPSFHNAHGALWPYSERMDPVIVDCAPLHITDVLLEPGETVTDVALGDSERWLVTPAAGGNPTEATPHVLFKAEMANLSTNASIFTNRHTYRLALRSHAHTKLDWVQFYFPDEVLAQMHVADMAPANPEPTDPVAPTVDLSRLNFAYKIDSTRRLPWTPVKVFDDGTRTWIEMPQTTSPITPALLGDGGTMLNYRVRNNYYLVDSLFNRAELISGAGREQDKVTITRTEQ